MPPSLVAGEQTRLHSACYSLRQSGTPATVNLVISATEVGGTGLSSSAAVSILVSAVPTPPTISPGQVLAVDEFHCYHGSIVGGLSASSPYFAIANYSITTNPQRPLPGPGSAALNIDTSSGQVKMAIALSYGPDVVAYIWNGYQVRQRKRCFLEAARRRLI